MPEASFDAVISRVGLIYFPDQQRALAGMRKALKPGGRVAAIVYSTAESNKFFSIPVSIIRRRADLPAPLAGQPGPFSLGAPGVLEDQLAKAEFRDIETRRVAAPVKLNSAAECVRFEKNHSAHCIRCSPASMRLAAALLGQRSSRSSATSRDRPASKAPAR